MPITPTEKIWMNGELVDWDDAKIHVGAHGLHYGTGVFEGIRCYDTPQGATVFRRRLGHVGRRHGARSKFTDDLLPDVGTVARAGDVGLVQPQASCLEPSVVAGDAVAIEHLTVARHEWWHRTGR